MATTAGRDHHLCYWHASFYSLRRYRVATYGLEHGIVAVHGTPGHWALTHRLAPSGSTHMRTGTRDGASGVGLRPLRGCLCTEWCCTERRPRDSTGRRGMPTHHARACRIRSGTPRERVAIPCRQLPHAPRAGGVQRAHQQCHSTHRATVGRLRCAFPVRHSSSCFPLATHASTSASR